MCNNITNHLHNNSNITVCIRVESGSDDLDNLGHLGHFFRGSSRSHAQTKLSGCDLDRLDIICFMFFRK